MQKNASHFSEEIRFVDEMTFDEWGIDSAKRSQKKMVTPGRKN